MNELDKEDTANFLGETSVTEDEFRRYTCITPTVEALHSNGTDRETARQQIERFVAAQPALFKWLEQHGRQFPWRQTSDPWEVFVAEILLQRTRAETVEPVYTEFIDRFPEPAAVIRSIREEIRELVVELGFGSQRSRTIREAAAIIVTEHGGTVPADPDELEEIWRIGPYCSRATVLFAHDKPVTLVDSNIARFFERQFDYKMPQQPHRDREVERLVSGVTPDNPGLTRAFYFAILDLASVVCSPNSPRCDSCPARTSCMHTPSGIPYV